MQCTFLNIQGDHVDIYMSHTLCKFAQQQGGTRVGTFTDDNGELQSIFTMTDDDVVDGHPWFEHLLPAAMKDRVRESDIMGHYIHIPLQEALEVPELQLLIETSDTTKVAGTKKLVYRERVATIIYNDAGDVLVDKDSGHYNFPGGGTEGTKVNAAAKKEALEEVGWEIKDVESVGVSPIKFVWPEDFKKKQRAKGRQHDGFRNHVRIAKAHKKNKKLLGSEGDAKKTVKFVTLKAAITSYKKRVAKKENAWRVCDQQMLDALNALEAKIKKDDVQKHAAWNVYRAAGLCQ